MDDAMDQGHPSLRSFKRADAASLIKIEMEGDERDAEEEQICEKEVPETRPPYYSMSLI
jgi:hypothetical protein